MSDTIQVTRVRNGWITSDHTGEQNVISDGDCKAGETILRAVHSTFCNWEIVVRRTSRGGISYESV